MTTSLFVPNSPDFVKNKARQLKRAFPGLAISKAQEATAVALGYQGWFDCSKRIAGRDNISTTTRYDEDLPYEEFLIRRHQQFCALVDVAMLTPSDAEYFIRCWGLTQKGAATRLHEFNSTFTALVKEGHNLVSEGITLGPISKYDYYSLDSKRLMNLPSFIRGYTATYLEFELGLALPIYLPEMRLTPDAVNKGMEYLRQNEPKLYEWQTGECTERLISRGESLAHILQDALSHPDAWFALSFRYSTPDMIPKPDTGCYIPALKGTDFAWFIENKADFKLKNVRWFYLSAKDFLSQFCDPLTRSYSLRLRSENLTQTAPLYHYPFKHGPMSQIEYDFGCESDGMQLTAELDPVLAD